MQAFIVVDLGFGDAGKGSLVDFLTRHHHAHTIIRFNGGAQAAHNVITPDGRHHTFSQFGSGTFVEGVRTHLSRFMLVDPLALLQEEAHLQTLGIPDAFTRLSIDRRAIVVTPFQKAANRLRELARGDGRHGSCGMGIGETMADSLIHEPHILRVGDLLDPHTVRAKLQFLQKLKRDQSRAFTLPNPPHSPLAQRELDLLHSPAPLEEFTTLFHQLAHRITILPSSAPILSAPGNIIFEGAQGVLLDEWYGFHPYTTWSTTTFANALTLLSEHRYPGQITRIGATRAYMTRHGPGPFPTEDLTLTRLIPERHNRTNPWQRHFRIGWLDLPLLQYALTLTGGRGGVDQLALTCLDHLDQLPNPQLCTQYQTPNPHFLPNHKIRRAPSPDLDYQEKLTQHLLTQTPNLETIHPDDLIPTLEDHLGFPFGLTSTGPTHESKQLRMPCTHFSQPAPTLNHSL